MEIHGLGFIYIWPQDKWKSMVWGLSIYGPGINGNPWFGVCLGPGINGNPWLGVCLYMAPGSMEIHGWGSFYIWPQDQWKSMVGGLSIYGPRMNGNPWFRVCLYMAPGSMEIHGLGLSIYGPGINGNPWFGVCLYMAP